MTPAGRGAKVAAAGGSPTVRRRELGAMLRELRSRKGWTAEEVAGRLLVSTSKVSRLETGQRGASPRDIRDLCDLYEVTGAQRQRMLDLARESKQRAWWQGRGLPYSTYVGLEAEAASISDFGLGIVPGLLQTADYARTVVQAAPQNWEPAIVEQRVEARLARQQLLISDQPPHFEAVIEESVLHRVVGSRAIMQAQLRRLLEMSELPSVTLRVIPYEAGVLPAENNKFIILEFALPTVPDVVFIEGLTRDLYLEDPADVAVYKATFQTLRHLAAGAEATREQVSEIITGHGVEPA
jgi:Domain of unknown function (DUF5753)/Helix-turn-helix domain